MTRFLMVPVAAIAFLLIGAPYAAAVEQSPRSALMPETIAACREQALSLEKLMALMALNGVSVNEVCECQALFISKLDDSWVRYLNREGVGQRLPQTLRRDTLRRQCPKSLRRFLEAEILF
jgi:hypothetical protein